MNINSAISNGSKILSKNSILSAQLDSEILMAETVKKDRNFILLNYDKVLNKNDINYFFELIEKRCLGNPISYLINKKFFWNSEFFITNDVLIPRPDTELLIENVLNLTKQKSKVNVLEIGVGSGCILLSILKERKNFYGTGIDISKKCLKITKINADTLPLEISINFAAASAVPPVAIKSSITKTLSSFSIQSLFTSIVAVPYSNSKSIE